MNALQLIDYDPYWATVVYLFSNHSKLQSYLTDEYVNIHEGFIEQGKLLRVSRTWSRSEKFILQLALHLYSNQVQLDLNEIDFLDKNNKHLVLEALRIRFSGI